MFPTWIVVERFVLLNVVLLFWLIDFLAEFLNVAIVVRMLFFGKDTLVWGVAVEAVVAMEAVFAVEAVESIE